MKRIVSTMAAALISGLLAAGMFTAAMAGAGQAMGAKTGTENMGLEMIKRLAGEWKGTAGEENEAVTVRYAVTAGGSTVMETLFPGTPHEMVTMYQSEGNALVLTHYCVIGNQPKMRGKVAGDGKKITFDFAGGANIDPAKDMHMHSATITFIDKDHIKTEWTMYQGGKSAEVKTFDLTRKS